MGVVYGCPPPASGGGGGGGGRAPPSPSEKPYAAAQDAVTLTFLLQFYEQSVEAADLAREAAGRPPMSTDEVAKSVIMDRTWDRVTGRARRFVGAAQFPVCGSLFCRRCGRESRLVCGVCVICVCKMRARWLIRCK